VITDINVALALAKVFSAVKFIPDEGKLTEYPAPDVQKEITYPASLHTEEEWQHKPWKK
jgi:hypothetical protein